MRRRIIEGDKSGIGGTPYEATLVWVTGRDRLNHFGLVDSVAQKVDVLWVRPPSGELPLQYSRSTFSNWLVPGINKIYNIEATPGFNTGSYTDKNGITEYYYNSSQDPHEASTVPDFNIKFDTSTDYCVYVFRGTKTDMKIYSPNFSVRIDSSINRWVGVYEDVVDNDFTNHFNYSHNIKNDATFGNYIYTKSIGQTLQLGPMNSDNGIQLRNIIYRYDEDNTSYAPFRLGIYW